MSNTTPITAIQRFDVVFMGLPHDALSNAVLLNQERRINTDLTARGGKKVFEPGKTHTVQLAVFGYKTVTLNYNTVPGGTLSAPSETVKYGEANVEIMGTTYPVRMAVTIDAAGKILKIEDNSSETNGFNNIFFGDALRCTAPAMVGKTVDDVSLKKEEVDGITGATLSFNGINGVVVKALGGT